MQLPSLFFWTHAIVAILVAGQTGVMASRVNGASLPPYIPFARGVLSVSLMLSAMVALEDSTYHLICADCIMVGVIGVNSLLQGMHQYRRSAWPGRRRVLMRMLAGVGISVVTLVLLWLSWGVTVAPLLSRFQYIERQNHAVLTTNKQVLKSNRKLEKDNLKMLANQQQILTTLQTKPQAVTLVVPSKPRTVKSVEVRTRSVPVYLEDPALRQWADSIMTVNQQLVDKFNKLPPRWQRKL